jgi:hypothetical protein
MAHVTCELLWLEELHFCEIGPMELVCDNQSALHLSSNPVFHERTKHIEVDCHFLREKILTGIIKTSFVNSRDQLADIFTKSLRSPRITYICDKMDAYDIYTPPWGGVLRFSIFMPRILWFYDLILITYLGNHVSVYMHCIFLFQDMKTFSFKYF